MKIWKEAVAFLPRQDFMKEIKIRCSAVPTLWRVLIWSYPLHPLSRVLVWHPSSPSPPTCQHHHPSGPVIRSFLHFREQQTSEAVWTFPVEWSQQPKDLTNGDKHKPALTSATLHSNKEMEQVQPNKSSLQVLCVCVCMSALIMPGSFLYFDHFQMILGMWFFSDYVQMHSML